MDHRTVLVVDDEESVLRILDRFLQQMGFAVEVCDSSEDALARFYQERYDLIILDINMPGKDGFQLAKEMRMIRPEQKILVITGLDAGQVFNHLLSTDADFDDILYKPFSFEKIQEVVGNVMS